MCEMARIFKTPTELAPQSLENNLKQIVERHILWQWHGLFQRSPFITQLGWLILRCRTQLDRHWLTMIDATILHGDTIRQEQTNVGPNIGLRLKRSILGLKQWSDAIIIYVKYIWDGTGNSHEIIVCLKYSWDDTCNRSCNDNLWTTNWK